MPRSTRSGDRPVVAMPATAGRVRIASASPGRRGERPEHRRPLGELRLDVARLPASLGRELRHDAPGEVLEPVLGVESGGEHRRALGADVARAVAERRPEQMRGR